MAKTAAELPTLEDFTEKSLLATAKASKQQTAETEEEEELEAEEEVKVEKLKPVTDKTKKPVVPVTPPGKKEVPVETEGKKKEKPATAKPEAETEEEEEEEEEEQEQESFWTDVEKLTGMKVTVNYGDVDPETPQGAALRDQALAEQVMANYADYLKEKFPRAYKILEHEVNGGKIEDLLTPSYIDYSKIELKEDNKDQQKKILLDYYKDKGIDEKKALKIVDAEEDSEEGLFNAAKVALAERIKAQELNEKKLADETKQRQLAKQQQDQQFTTSISQAINTGKLGQFTILNKKDKEDFLDHVLSNIHRSPDDNGYILALPVQSENMTKILQQLYFGFKNGELGQYIDKAAESKNVKKLKRNVDKADNKISNQEEKANVNKALPTLDAFNAK